MKTYACFLLAAIIAATCLAADSTRPDAKTAKTNLNVKCPQCENVVIATVRGKDVRCHGGYSVTNGVMSQYTAKVTCPRCKNKFDTKFEQFSKAPPKAVVVP